MNATTANGTHLATMPNAYYYSDEPTGSIRVSAIRADGFETFSIGMPAMCAAAFILLRTPEQQDEICAQIKAHLRSVCGRTRGPLDEQPVIATEADIKALTGPVRGGGRMTLNEAMDRRQLSGRAVARALGVSAQTLSNWRRGLVLPSAASRTALVRLLPGVEIGTREPGQRYPSGVTIAAQRVAHREQKAEMDAEMEALKARLSEMEARIETMTTNTETDMDETKRAIEAIIGDGHGRTTAEAIAYHYGDDGQRCEDDHGTRIEDVCDDLGQREGHHERSDISRHEFDDGSALVIASPTWDVEGDEPFSWAGR